MKKRIVLVLFFLLLVISSAIASQELFDAYSYEYNTITKLCILSGVTGPSSVTPITKNELKIAYDRINVEKLPSHSIAEYRDIGSLFNETDDFSYNFGLNISPQLFIEKNYYDGDRNSFFLPYSKEVPSVEIGGGFNFGNNAFIEGYIPVIDSPLASGTFIHSFSWLINKRDGVLNIMGTNSTGMNAEVPFIARGSIGNEWVNLVIGRTSHSIGTGYTGNLIIGDNFAYQEIMKLGFNSKYFNYNISYTHFDTQIDKTKFDVESFSGKNQIRVDHRLDINLSKNFLFSADLCTLYYSDAALDPRFFNPLMIAHNYYNYEESDVLTLGDEANNLFGISFDWIVLPGLKLGGQFALDQFQLGFEDKDALPQATGYLINLSYSIPFANRDVLTVWSEAVYTSDYLYCNTKFEDSNKTIPNYNYDYMVGYKRRDWQASSISYSGYPEGPSATVFAIGSEYVNNSVNISINSILSYTVKGTKGILDPTLIPSTNKIKQKTINLRTIINWDINRFASIFGGASLRYFINYGNVENQNKFEPQAYLGCTIKIRNEK